MVSCLMEVCSKNCKNDLRGNWNEKNEQIAFQTKNKSKNHFFFRLKVLLTGQNHSNSQILHNKRMEAKNGQFRWFFGVAEGEPQ